MQFKKLTMLTHIRTDGKRANQTDGILNREARIEIWDHFHTSNEGNFQLDPPLSKKDQDDLPLRMADKERQRARNPVNRAITKNLSGGSHQDGVNGLKGPS